MTLRYLRSAVKYLTTATERKWLRLQAEYVVVDESQNERDYLLKSIERKSLRELLLMVDDASSAFDTDEQNEFFDELNEKKDFKLREQDLRLMCGVFNNQQQNISKLISKIAKSQKKNT